MSTSVVLRKIKKRCACRAQRFEGCSYGSLAKGGWLRRYVQASQGLNETFVT